MTQKIEAVIFDLGRVLVNIDLEPLKKQLSSTGIINESGDLIEKVRESDLIPQLNSGKISFQQFHRSLCSRYGFDWSLDLFHDAWCSIFYPSPAMEALVRDLHGRVPLGLLSDTDLSHWTYIRRHYPIVEVFKGPVLSFQVGVCKPDPAMYRAAAQSVGLPPQQCFYTDDLPGNIEGARAAGMTAILFQDADQIRQELKNYGIL
jgi:FMN phosphatase YigB (HAD superfamily)